MIIATHNGPFHADDVFACALLKRFVNRSSTVVRTRDQSLIDSADVAVDVGGIYDPENCRFDHHQNSYEGTKSSVGLVLDWLEQTEQVHPFVAGELRSSLVDELDDADTNGTHSAISLLIWAMNPQWDDENPKDSATKFNSALLMADYILRTTVNVAESKLKASNIMDNLVDFYGGAIVESSEDLPDLAFEISRRSSQAMFVIWPASETQWMVQCVPPKNDRTSQRLPFPEAVAGLRGEDLEGVVGDLGFDVNPASPFVHKGRFIGGAATREGAYALAQFALASLSAGIEL